MSKTAIREIMIALLLCLAIILVLGILMYQHVPMAKTIPNPVSYTAPDNVKQELADTDEIDESQIVMTYEVDADDLRNYKQIDNYKPGKANPFSSYETPVATSTTGSTTTENAGTGESSSSPNTSVESTNNSNGTTSQTQETTTSGGQFFQDKGTK